MDSRESSERQVNGPPVSVDNFYSVEVLKGREIRIGILFTISCTLLPTNLTPLQQLIIQIEPIIQVQRDCSLQKRSENRKYRPADPV